MIQQPQQPPMQQTSEVPVYDAEPLAQEAPQPMQEQPQVEQRTSNTWAEEVDDESQPFQQQQHKNESNTWTNSNYRSNDHGTRRLIFALSDDLAISNVKPSGSCVAS